MRRVRCPRCAITIDLPNSETGPVGSCSACGQRFRIPARKEPGSPGAAGKDSSRGGERAAGRGDTARAGAEPVPRPRSRRAEPQPEENEPDDREPDSEEEDRRKSRRGAEPVVRLRKRRPEPEPEEDEPEDRKEDAQDEPDEEQPRPRRRRKKRKRAREVDPNLVAMIVSCIALVFLCAGGIYIFQKMRPHKEPVTPDQALAALQKAGVILQRDPATQEVIGADFSPTSDGFRASLIDQLVAFPKLRKLSLNGTTATGYHLDHLEGLASVTILSLGHTNMTDGGMRYIALYLPNLEELDISQTLVTDNGLTDLRGLKKLRKIRVGGSLARARGLQAVLPHLEVID